MTFKIRPVKELQQLLERGFKCERNRALFAICFFSACRISEALIGEKVLIFVFNLFVQEMG